MTTLSDQNLVETLNAAVQQGGHRLTPARRIIIETLVGCRGHISADDLAARVRLSAPHIGRMTVYRTLDLLCDLGMLRPIYQGTGAAHYILMAGGSHHHLICTRCHTVIEFDECLGEALADRLAEAYDFALSSHLLELFGVCAACRAVMAR